MEGNIQGESAGAEGERGSTAADAVRGDADSDSEHADKVLRLGVWQCGVGTGSRRGIRQESEQTEDSDYSPGETEARVRPELQDISADIQSED